MATTPKPKKYFVVVRPARPQPPKLISQQQANYFNGPTPIVKTVEAESPEAAAEAVGVPAGATVYVALSEHVQRFKRPEKAPLVAA